MKKIIIAALALAVSVSAFAQPKFPDYQFTTVKENPITPVKNQYRSGTCWCFSTLGFVESEIIRINKIKDADKYPDLSEMFVVSKSYQDRGEKFIRLDGHLNFAAGSEADDVLHVIADYGIVPQAAMPGLTELPVHAEVDAATKAYVEAISKSPAKPLSPNWKTGLVSICDAFFGVCPESFEVNGKTYTPAEYRDALKFNPADYVTLTSFTHHPFYTSFVLEICDNWRWDAAYNVPIDEFIEALDNALENGYTAAWGTDVSDPGFTRNGLAILVDTQKKSTSGSDQEHWVGKAEEKPEQQMDTVVEKVATQESRQEGFDNKTITDDHGMQIFGIAKDQFGKKYYMVKNSWGETGKYNGIWYATEAFVRNQSMDIMIHRDALPKATAKKLGLK
ncbi:MAG: aminopeptidase [Bacteroidales bacterium]|nr:aminopeptidase [Bacteroidales bacterium]